MKVPEAITIVADNPVYFIRNCLRFNYKHYFSTLDGFIVQIVIVVSNNGQGDLQGFIACAWEVEPSRLICLLFMHMNEEKLWSGDLVRVRFCLDLYVAFLPVSTELFDGFRVTYSSV